jgi:tRNA threonylcarbamoyladenosine modification (KEOPS) complex  Pcc1 subunit
MRATCLLEVEYPDKKSAAAAALALSHEGGSGSRSSAQITKKDKQVTIDIEAKDVVAMRATLNAFLRALAVFEKK